jgi:hypothetical protein
MKNTTPVKPLAHSILIKFIREVASKYFINCFDPQRKVASRNCQKGTHPQLFNAPDTFF